MELCHHILLVYELSTRCLAKLGCLSEYAGVSTSTLCLNCSCSPACGMSFDFLAVLVVKATAAWDVTSCRLFSQNQLPPTFSAQGIGSTLLRIIGQ